MSEHEIHIDQERCIGCGQCVKDCPAGNIALKEKTASMIEAKCVLCGHCAAICPCHAIAISGYAEEAVEQTVIPRLDSKEVLDVIRFRRTIRQFQNKAVDAAVIAQILEAGRLTHTAKNLQDVSYVILDRSIKDMERLAVGLFRKLKPFANLFSSMVKRTVIHDHFFFFHAPIAIIILAKEEINGSLAAANMEFAAEANGLGVLYSGFFTMAVNHSRRLRKAMQIPRGKKAVTTLVLGYPQVRYRRSAQREDLDARYL